jgi:hypothetical protein
MQGTCCEIHISSSYLEYRMLTCISPQTAVSQRPFPVHHRLRCLRDHACFHTRTSNDRLSTP